MEQRDLLGEPIRPFRLAKYPEREAQRLAAIEAPRDGRGVVMLNPLA